MDHKHECANFPKCWREWGCDYVDDDEAQVCRLCLEAALATALDALEAADTYMREVAQVVEAAGEQYRLWNGPGVRVECTTCRRPKLPYGRSGPPEAASGYCDWDCPGYREAPPVGSLWPGETREDFGFGWPDWLTPEVRAALATVPVAPVERVRSVLVSRDRSLRWPEGTP
jgi:type II secretory pathway pseudopilin PulG